MWFVYRSLLLILLSQNRFYRIWILIEFRFLYFFLIIFLKENKNIGIIIYFFFQRVISFILFISMVCFFNKIVFLVLLAKLGMFPFFYWIIVVSIKVSYLGNVFILTLQKLRVFWLLWLYRNVRLVYLYFFNYLRLFFVVISLITVVDFWLFLVFRSIANSGLIVVRVLGSNYFFLLILYLCVVVFIIIFIYLSFSMRERIIVVFFFLVVPPFFLFFIKFYVLLRLDYFLKLGFFIAFFDVLILFYYFSFIFMKFILIDVSILVYFMSLITLIRVLFYRNYVAMIIFNKS